MRRRQVLLGAIALAVVGVAGVIIGTSLSDAHDAAKITTLRQADFGNRTYSLACDGPYVARFIDGEWRPTPAEEDPVLLEPGAGEPEVLYLDLTDDPGQEAVVLIQCSFGVNSTTSNVFVFRLADGRPEQIGETIFGFAPEATADPESFALWAEAPESADPGCCPSQYRRVIYRVEGSEVIEVDSQVIDTEDTPFR